MKDRKQLEQEYLDSYNRHEGALINIVIICGIILLLTIGIFIKVIFF